MSTALPTPTFEIPTLPAVHFKVDHEVNIILDEAGHPLFEGRRKGIVEACEMLRDAGWDVNMDLAAAGTDNWSIERIVAIHDLGNKYGHLEEYCAVKIEDYR